jgi:hypothetical protein
MAEVFLRTRDAQKWIARGAQSYLWSDKLFIISYLSDKTRAEKGGLSWVEPLKPKGPNLFDIGALCTVAPLQLGEEIARGHLD